MFNFTFSMDDTNIILAALSELPAKISLNVINNIQSQAEPQMAALKAQAELAARNDAETQESE